MRTTLTIAFIALLAAVLQPVGAHDETGRPHRHLPTDYTLAGEAGDDAAPIRDEEGFAWWKGNLHTHTLWSDGDQYPEVVTRWYRESGYHFLALSDHNVLSRGQRWINPATHRHAAGTGGGMEGFERYRELFGEEWVETRQNDDGQLEVRLKPLAEFRTLFEAPGRFLMIESEEITDQRSVHVNATNLAEYIPPQGGDSVEETVRRNLQAVLEQRRRTGQLMFPHLNHPNFATAITVEEMVQLPELKLFEIYNGHRGVRNYGNEALHIKPLERMWDIMLARRLGELGLGVLYGLAVDDAHHYGQSTSDTARPGRGWVMVRARFLTPEHLIAAIEAGDFYASTGVVLRKIERTQERLAVEIAAEEGVEYTIEFIGTRRGFDPASEPVLDEEGNEIRATRRYSQEIGQVLKTVTGTSAAYELEGDELYVRARITSSRPKENPFAEGEKEMAWVQPVTPAR